MDDVKLVSMVEKRSPIHRLELDGEEIDLTHLNINVSKHIDCTGVLLFYAFKEIQRLSNEMSELVQPANLVEKLEKVFKDGYIKGFTEGMEKGQQHVIDNLVSAGEKMRKKENE